MFVIDRGGGFFYVDSSDNDFILGIYAFQISSGDIWFDPIRLLKENIYVHDN